MPKFLHIGLFFVIIVSSLFLLINLGLVMTDQFLELLDPQLIQPQLFLFILQNQQLLLLLKSFLLQLWLNCVDLVVPCLFWLFSFFLKFQNLFVQLGDHLWSYGLLRLRWGVLFVGVCDRRVLFGLGLFFLFRLFDLLLHLLDLSLLCQVKLMIFPQISLIFYKSLRQNSTFLLNLRDILLEPLNLILVLMIVSDQLKRLGLLFFDLIKRLFLILKNF